MGCTPSADKIKKFDFEASYRDKYHKLFDENKKLVKYLEEEGLQRPSREELNVLRYEIEILLTMLAMEEKSKDIISKRLEAAKLIIMSQGNSQQQLDDVISATLSQNTSCLEYEIEISSAIEKMKKSFVTLQKDIVEAFLDGEGNVLISLSRDAFIEKLSTITTNQSKRELEFLSIRFMDVKLEYVSAIEFLSYFTTPTNLRDMQRASNAVLMSQDISDFKFNRTSNTEYSELLNGSTLFEDEKDVANFSMTGGSIRSSFSLHESGSPNIRRFPTKQLDSCITKMVLMWPYCKEALANEFFKIRLEQMNTISSTQFKGMVIKICGTQSELMVVLKEHHLPINEETIIKMALLRPHEVDILVEFFEMGGRIHFKQFYRVIEKKLRGVDMFDIRKLSSLEEIDHYLSGTSRTSPEFREQKSPSDCDVDTNTTVKSPKKPNRKISTPQIEVAKLTSASTTTSAIRLQRRN